MKLTKTANTKIKPGMTLIEITVVILVLLTLIAVLFIGANIYKQGADRAACILNIRNIHQDVRADQNLNGKNAGDTLTSTDIIGTGKYIETAPACPTAGGTYTMDATYPVVSNVAALCAEFDGTSGSDAAAADRNHTPDNINGW